MWRSCGGVASKRLTKFRYFIGEERSEAVSKGWCYFLSVQTEIKCNYSLFSVHADGNLYAYIRYFPSVRTEIYS